MTAKISAAQLVIFFTAALALLIFASQLSTIGFIPSLAFSYSIGLAGALIWLGITLRDQRIDTISLISTLFISVLGPLGALMVVIIFAVMIWVGDRRNDLQWLLSSGKDRVDSSAVLLARRLRSLQAEKGNNRYFSTAPIVPFLDIVRYGSLSEKRRALTQIGRHFDARYIPALQISLKDPSNLVRVHTASVMTFIRTRISEREQLLQEKLMEHPASWEFQLNLAKIKTERAKSAVIEGVPASAPRSEAIALLQDLEAQNALAAEGRMLLAELLLDEERFEEARPQLRHLLRQPLESSYRLGKLIEQWLLGTKKYSALVRYSHWNSLRNASAIQLRHNPQEAFRDLV